MKVKAVKHKVTLDDFERRMLINCVNQARTFLHSLLKKYNKYSII